MVDCYNETWPREGILASNLPILVEKDTKLLRLRLGLATPHDNDQHDVFRDAPDTIHSLLKHSPHLQQLSLSIGHGSQAGDRLLGVIGELLSLTDLHWRGSGSEMRGSEAEMISSPSLRRLAIYYPQTGWSFPSASAEVQSFLPSLEIVFVYSDSADYLLNICFQPPAPTLPLEPGFASWLYQRPRLHSMYIEPLLAIVRSCMRSPFAVFDDLERSHTPNLRVSSIRRGDKELLDVWIRLHERTASKIWNEPRWKGFRRVIDHTRSQGDGPKVHRKAPTWQRFTHFNGAMVPVEIVQMVKDVEDPAGMINWEKRGVEVGAEAWKVLTDWRGKLSEKDVENESAGWTVQPRR